MVRLIVSLTGRKAVNGYRYLLLVVIDISPLIGGATRDYGFLSTAALFTPGQAGGYVGSSPVPTAHQTSLFQPLFVVRCSLFIVH